MTSIASSVASTAIGRSFPVPGVSFFPAFVDSPVEPEGLIGGRVHGSIKKTIDVRGNFMAFEFDKAISYILASGSVLDKFDGVDLA